MSCRHQWAGAVIKGPVNHILVDQCEKCGKLRLQDAAPPAQGIDLVPRPMDTAPRDGTMVRLLVQFTEHATEDTDGPSWTIGANNGEHDGGDLWCFAGWCWTHDHFTEGKGTPVGWLPLIDDQRDAAPGVGNGPTCKDPLQVASCRMENGNG